MKKLTSILVTGALVAGLAGCADNGYPYGYRSGPYATTGTVVGGVAGGLVGSTIGSGGGTVVAVVGGVLLGSFLGNQIGSYFDQQSQVQTTSASERAFETGRVVRWESPRAYGKVVPGRRFVTSTGHVCRHFTTTVVFKDSGRVRVFHGVACRNVNGVWVVR